MATQLSRLAIVLGVDARDLATGLSRSRKSVEGFASSVRTTLQNAFAFAGGQLLVRGFDKAVAAVKSQFQEIDRLAKVSDRTGLLIGDLQELAHVADLAGVDFETLTKGVKTFQVRLGEALAGESEAVRSFERIGIKANQLLGLPQAKQLELVIERVQGLTQAQRQLAASELFGRGGFSLLSIQAQDLRNALEASEKVGASLSRFDAAKVEAANDAFTNLFEVMKRIAQQLTVAVSPTITRLVDRLTSATQTLAKGFFASLSEDIKTAGGVLEAFFQQFSSVTDILGNLSSGRVITRIAVSLVDAFNAIAKTAVFIADTLIAAANEIRSAIRDTREVAGAVTGTVRRGGGVGANARKILGLPDPEQATTDPLAAVRGFLSNLKSGADLVKGAGFDEAMRDLVGEVQENAKLLRRQKMEAAEALRLQQQEARDKVFGFGAGLLEGAAQLAVRFRDTLQSSDISLPDTAFTGAIEAGTVEAAVAALSARDPAKDLQRKLQEDQLKAEQQTAQGMTKLVDWFLSGRNALQPLAIPGG